MVPPRESQFIIAIIFLADGCILKFLAHSDICLYPSLNTSNDVIKKIVTFMILLQEMRADAHTIVLVLFH
jgi:hypothetical protein